jgi:uncharacterized protein YegL
MQNMTGQEVLLFYIVCDESGSMGPNGGIAAINQALPELHATLAADPLVVDKSRLSIIAFSDNAEVILPLCKVTDVADMPGVTEAGLTNYGTAFALLQSTIENDVNLVLMVPIRQFSQRSPRCVVTSDVIEPLPDVHWPT